MALNEGKEIAVGLVDRFLIMEDGGCQLYFYYRLLNVPMTI